MPNANAQPILEVRNLKKYFKSGRGKNRLVVKAIDDVTFHINKGEVFGLVGESGCGKTTTGRTIIKLYEPTDGEVFFLGQRIGAGTEGLKDEIKAKRRSVNKQLRGLRAEMMQKAANATDAEKKALQEDFQKAKDDLNEAKKEYIEAKKLEISKRKSQREDSPEVMRKMQMIFQDPIASLDPRMTVKEIIAEGLRIAGVRSDKEIMKRVNESLETVGLLPEHASRYPHEFSGGQRQRIGIARALVVNPEFIIADEPVSALDVSIQAQVINLLNDLRQKYGITILFIAHDLSIVKYFSDKIGVMYYGNLVELAPSEELFLNPLHPYTQSLLSAVPLPDPRYEKTRKRKAYKPHEVHNYKESPPTLYEIKEDHYVLANEEEIANYKKILK